MYREWADVEADPSGGDDNTREQVPSLAYVMTVFRKHERRWLCNTN